MANPIPQTAGQIIGLATKMQNGLSQYGSQIPVSIITTTDFQTLLAAFIAQDTDFGEARSDWQKASDTYQADMVAVFDWLMSARGMLTSHWGQRWSTVWAQAGFVNNSTAVPKRVDDRLKLMLSLASFLTKNTNYEVPVLSLTAAQATLLRNNAVASQQVVAAKEVILGTLGQTRDAAQVALVAAMRSVVRNLDSKLGPDDPRWDAFGLNRPAANTTPGQPVDVIAHADGTGAIVAQCAEVPLATRYRWRTRLVGEQPDYKLAASTPGPIGALTGYLPGQTVEIIVQAVNVTQQGVASEPITFTLPPTQAAESNAPQQGRAEGNVGHGSFGTAKVIAAGNGNGHGHGNGNGNGHSHTRPARMS